MKTYSYHLLNVFTSVTFGGNSLAVFTEAEGLTDGQMQRIARELNLSETTFVLPARSAEHHYWVRIFTPLAELTNGGHPTIGTAYALAMEERIRRETLKQRVVFEQASGPVSVRMESPMIMMSQPTPEFGKVFDQRDAIAAMLGLDNNELMPRLPIQCVSCNVPYLIVPVRDLEAMARIRLRMDIWERVLRHSPHPHLLPFTMQAVNPDSTLNCRMFAPGLGLPEDPATATAAGPLAAYAALYSLIPNEPMTRMIVEQGVQIGRSSSIHVALERSAGRFQSLRVGGQCAPIGRGQIYVD